MSVVQAMPAATSELAPKKEIGLGMFSTSTVSGDGGATNPFASPPPAGGTNGGMAGMMVAAPAQPVQPAANTGFKKDAFADMLPSNLANKVPRNGCIMSVYGQ